MPKPSKESRQLEELCEQFREVSGYLEQLRADHRQLARAIKQRVPKGEVVKVGRFEVRHKQSLRVLYRGRR